MDNEKCWIIRKNNEKTRAISTQFITQFTIYIIKLSIRYNKDQMKKSHKQKYYLIQCKFVKERLFCRIYSRFNIYVTSRLGTLGLTPRVFLITGFRHTLGKNKTNIHSLTEIRTRDAVYEPIRSTPQTSRSPDRRLCFFKKSVMAISFRAPSSSLWQYDPSTRTAVCL
jgi:hypothetical protein